MDWMYLFYFALAALVFFGAKCCARGEWNEEFTSLKQTKILQGITALGIALHHMAQKTCAPWIPSTVRVHGLDFFVGIGFPAVAVFLFCSGLGLYRSLHTKPDYLKHFFRRRVLPVVIAYYLSEFIYTAVRMMMGERMNLTKILWYLSGLHMANTNAWYVIAITFFYLIFWAAFRFCKREGFAIFWVFVFTVAYTVLGAFIDHQNDWWMRGEWWYNSIILFPIGLLFGRHEKQVTRFFRKGYWVWLIFFFAGTILLYIQSDYLVDNRWGYYWEGTRMKVPYSLLSAGCQWLVCIVFIAFCFLLMMKVRFGNKALAWLGSVTLEFYLVHGLFVELFGYGFLDVAKSLYYIRKVPLYIAAVLICSAIGTLLFRWLWKTAVALLTGERKKKQAHNKEPGSSGTPERILKLQKGETIAAKALRIIRWLIWPALLLAVAVIMLTGFRKDGSQTVGGLIVTPPAGFSQTSTSTRQVIWKYTLDDRKPGVLILDREIRGDQGQRFTDVDQVLEECYWLRDSELYVNPQGIRMARGFSIEFSDYPERRYYVETDSAVFVLCMIEDDRYFSPADCEEVMLQTADSIRRK